MDFEQDLTEVALSVPWEKLNMPNGGVINVGLYLSIPAAEAGPLPNFPYKMVAERLVFKKPDSTLRVRVNTDKAEYAPGERVFFEVDVVDPKTGLAPPNEVLVSLMVTDLSPFMEVE